MTTIAVIGESICNEDIYRIAEELGRNIAAKGWTTLTGGLGGVMEAACKGAKQAGGLTIGILPGFSKADANRFVDIPVVTAMSHARNVIIAYTADALIAVSGKYGTLSEIAVALKLGKPVIGIKTWDTIQGIVRVESPEKAIEKVLELSGKHFQ
jgi:uncharacterized protein (TIGR00725 family)